MQKKSFLSHSASCQIDMKRFFLSESQKDKLDYIGYNKIKDPVS